mgnify:CR=1 FL=1
MSSELTVAFPEDDDIRRYEAMTPEQRAAEFVDLLRVTVRNFEKLGSVLPSRKLHPKCSGARMTLSSAIT